MNIQWFPGHMAKTKRILGENLKLVDIVIEILDARIPTSSKNPEIDTLIKSKPKIIALNKSDLADDNISALWSKIYQEKGCPHIFIDSIKGTGIKDLKSRIKFLMKDKIQSQKNKGRIFVPIRTMVVGIPNVGKSSFINKIAGKASAITGDKPGVTKGKQWIRIDKDFDLLDTPGILWPKFEDDEVGLNLACTGAIKDDVFDKSEICSLFIEKLKILYPDNLMARYKLSSLDQKDGYHILKEIGKIRGAVISGGNIDFDKISSILLDEFRGGKLGKITLDRPTE